MSQAHPFGPPAHVFEGNVTDATFTALVDTDVVPEPTTFALVGVAIVLLGAGQRVRARRLS